MSRTSLRKEADKVQDKYQDIFQSLKNKKDYNKVLVLVEGPDDLFIYKILLDENKVVLDSSCSEQEGCANVLAILRELNDHPIIIKHQQLFHIAILDADFNRVLRKLQTDNNLFYTDAHDNEMMVIKSEHARASLGYTLSLNDQETEEMFQNVLKDLELLTLFKWHNMESGLGANFKHMDMMNFTQENLNRDDFLFEIVNRKSKACVSSLDGLRDFVKSHYIDAHNVYDLTNGHDFVARLCYWMKQNKRRQISYDEMEETLQCQFTKKLFSQTDMCKNINRWELQNRQIIS